MPHSVPRSTDLPRFDADQPFSGIVFLDWYNFGCRKRVPPGSELLQPADDEEIAELAAAAINVELAIRSQESAEADCRTTA